MITPKPPATQELLTVREAAELLRIHPGSLYRLIEENRITHYRVGRAVRLHRDDLFNQIRMEARR